MFILVFFGGVVLCFFLIGIIGFCVVIILCMIMLVMLKLSFGEYVDLE